MSIYNEKVIAYLEQVIHSLKADEWEFRDLRIHREHKGIDTLSGAIKPSLTGRIIITLEVEDATLRHEFHNNVSAELMPGIPIYLQNPIVD